MMYRLNPVLTAVGLFIALTGVSFGEAHGSGSMPQINDDGTKIVYREQMGSFDRINIVEFKNGLWLSPVVVTTKTTATYPSINADGNKIAYLGDDGVYFSEYVANSWQSTNVSTHGTFNTTGISDDGTRIVFRGANEGIYVTKNNSGTWETPIRIGSGNDPQISDDGLRIVWYEYDGNDDEIYLSKYDGTSWQSPTQVTSNSSYDRNPTINSNGNRMAFFRYNTYIYFTEDIGAWQSPELAASVPCCDSYPSVSDDGYKIAVKNLFIEYESGTWKSPVEIASSGGHPSINGDGTKIALVMLGEIRFVEWDGNGWSTPVVVSNTPIIEPPAANAGPDQVAVDDASLDASQSTDPDGTIESYEWILNHRADASYDRTANGVNPVVSGLQPGIYDVILTVTDDDGLTGTDTMVLTVFNAPEITNVLLYKNGNGLVQTTSFDIGDSAYFTVYAKDLDLDMTTLTVSRYYPSNSPNPYYAPNPLTLPAQPATETIYYNFNPITVDGPAGDWRVTFIIEDSRGNSSNVFEVNVSVIDPSVSTTDDGGGGGGCFIGTTAAFLK